jgi:hypothetical protein
VAQVTDKVSDSTKAVFDALVRNDKLDAACRTGLLHLVKVFDDEWNPGVGFDITAKGLMFIDAQAQLEQGWAKVAARMSIDGREFKAPDTLANFARLNIALAEMAVMFDRTTGEQHQQTMSYFAKVLASALMEATTATKTAE